MARSTEFGAATRGLPRKSLRRSSSTETKNHIFSLGIERLRNDRIWPHHVIIFMLDDVAVIDIGLRRANAGRQIILRADCRELSGICFDGVLETALGRIRRSE